jgi:hypothetical protein
MPYSWDDAHDFDTQSGQGYSFHSARKSYDDVAVAKTSSKVFYTYQSPFLTTDAFYPIVIGIDTTGSMQEWPKVFFDKLPLLYKEAIKYLPECEISFQAINDFHADGEDVALQPAPFGRGPALDELIGRLKPEGGGGGQGMESYEIFAAYNAFLEAPKALIKPIAVILGDEMPFETVPPAVCKQYGLLDRYKSQIQASTGKKSLKRSVPTSIAFERLHQKCDVFLIRKPYYGFGTPDEPIIKQWQKIALMPAERILNIQDPTRVVDVILGILGVLTGKAELFEQELRDRQNASQVKEVLDSLHDLQQSYHSQMSQHSVSQGIADIGKQTRSLV